MVAVRLRSVEFEIRRGKQADLLEVPIVCKQEEGANRLRKLHLV